MNKAEQIEPVPDKLGLRPLKTNEKLLGYPKTLLHTQASLLKKIEQTQESDDHLIEEDYHCKSAAVQNLNSMLLRTGTSTKPPSTEND